MKGKGLLIGGGILLAAGLAIGAVSMKNSRTIPKGVTAVTPFSAQKYLGTWYEIARLDFKYERGLDHVTANYSLNKNGSIKVVNSGYDAKKDKRKEAHGKAIFVDDPNVAMLKVSFFGPFYAGYNVVALDPYYRYALVIGRNLDYMWLLSRNKTMPQETIDRYLAQAKEIGYDTSRLLWTKQ